MPTAGQPAGGEETDLQNAVQAVLNEINGNLDSANLKDGTIGLADLATAVLNNFLKLAVGANLKLAVGSANPGSWAAVATLDMTVTHGLGVNPAFAIAIGEKATVSSATPIPITSSIHAFPDLNNLTFRLRTGDGAVTSTADIVRWIAIG